MPSSATPKRRNPSLSRHLPRRRPDPYLRLRAPLPDLRTLRLITPTPAEASALSRGKPTVRAFTIARGSLPPASFFRTWDWDPHGWLRPRLFVIGATVVGAGGFKPIWRPGELEVGYGVAPRFQGRGIATAALLLLAQLASQSPEITAVTATVRRDHAASIRVLEKAGFARQKGRKSQGLDVWRLPLPRRAGIPSSPGPRRG